MICAEYLLAYAEREHELATFLRGHGLYTLARRHSTARARAEAAWAYATGL